MYRLVALARRVSPAAMLVLALLVAAAFAPAALALTSRFVVNDGAQYARGLRVSTGDRGYSPFFRPGVVVWDGGSIVSGHGADAAHKFPAQTLAVVPRVCVSYVSSSGGARVDRMLAEGPVEVDSRYAVSGDLNVCVVQAGGGDFRHDDTATHVYAALRTYCAARRAAGFAVVVVTVLPADESAGFEVERLAYNAMVRETWTQFADGLADIAADGRIGDTGGAFDRQFFGLDARHPNNAGNTVMAAVAAPVLNALPWLSSRCEMRLRDTESEWGDWLPYAASKAVGLARRDGKHVIEAQYRLDGGDPVTVSDGIFVDTVRPIPVALGPVSVRRGHKAVLRYRVDDAEPCGPRAMAVIAVTRRGRVVKRYVRHRVPVGESMSVAFTCDLPKGSYRFVISARDAAGNPQRVTGSARLTVR